MTIRIRLFSIGLIVLASTIAAAQAKITVPDDGVAAPPPAPAPAPEAPKRPADMPPKPPKVTCQGDQITISADNSNLDAILAAVRGCTGAHIEIPDGAGRVRSFEELGPGPVRAVLDELLSGTPYNYVIQSSEANPLKVESVVLSMRTTDSGSQPTLPSDLPMTTGRRNWQHMQKFDKPDPSATADENGSEAADAPVAAESTPSTPSAAPAQPADTNAAQASAPSASATPDAAQAQAQPPAPGIAPVVDPNSSADPAKVTDDRIAAMQQMFDQRQKMIQKQNQGQSGSPNN